MCYVYSYFSFGSCVIWASRVLVRPHPLACLLREGVLASVVKTAVVVFGLSLGGSGFVVSPNSRVRCKTVGYFLLGPTSGANKQCLNRGKTRTSKGGWERRGRGGRASREREIQEWERERETEL